MFMNLIICLLVQVPFSFTIRYDWKQSFKQPLTFPINTTDIPFFHHSLPTPPDHFSSLTLTDSLPLERGAIWTQSTNSHSEWRVEFSFSVFGHPYQGGKGLAFWYSHNANFGTVFGGADEWHGLSIIFDSSDITPKHHTPHIYAILNDGRKFDRNQASAGCFRDYRNTDEKVWARIEYSGGTLQAWVDVTSNGNAYVECFKQQNVKLPPNHYFGLSAQTDDDSNDDHRIHSFEVYELNEQTKHVAKKKADFKMTDEMNQKIESVKKTLAPSDQKDLKKDKMKLFAKQIQQIQRNQLKMMDLMEVIYEKLEDHAQNPPNPSGKSELLGKKMESSLSYLHDKIDMHHDILKDVVDEKIAKLHSTVNQGHSTISNIWMAVLVFGVLYVIKISVQAYFAKDGKQKSRFD